MSGPRQQQPIKGLNNRPGKKRFVFKSFSQRIEEVDVDVFRSLAPVKFEPTGGSSFFHESLVAWRELNSAADFTSIYEEVLPIVQTLPQLLLHKELIMEKLLSRLQLSAVLSLEPMLSLIAILSRDLLGDFIPFIPRLLGSCVDLLQSGGDREPEVIEQVFTSLSYIFKYMQKLLSNNIIFVLKETKQLRYYHRAYIQEFAAESVSYLLRNTSVEQLIKGVRKMFSEVLCKPSKENVTSCSLLLWNILKGPSLTLHSRAEPILRLLLDRSTFTSARKKDPGGEIIVEILSETFCRLCEELDCTKLSLLWVCLIDELDSLLIEYIKCAILFDSEEVLDNVLDHQCVKDGMQKTNAKVEIMEDRRTYLQECQESLDYKLLQVHLARVLSLLNDVLGFRKGSRVSDFEPLFVLFQRFLQLNFFKEEKRREPSVRLALVRLDQAATSQLPFQIMRLMLALIKSNSRVAGASISPTAIVSHARSWRLVWNYSEFSSILFLVRGLLDQDTVIIQSFAPYLLRTFNEFIDMQPRDVLSLMMDFFEKIGAKTQSTIFSAIGPSQNLDRLVHFVSSIIREFTKGLDGGIAKMTSSMILTSETQQPEPAFVWAALNCYPHILLCQECDGSLTWSFVLALDRAMSKIEASGGSSEEDTSKELWEYILGVALSSEIKVLTQFPEKNTLSRVSDFLNLAVHHKHSPHVLKSVADLLDVHLRNSQIINIGGDLPLELKDGNAFSWFEGNLGSSNKLLRLSTLRFLTHYETFSIPLLGDDQVTSKRRKGIDGRPCKDGNATSGSIFQHLVSLEAAPFCLEISRQSSLLLTQLKVGACTGNMPEPVLVSLTHAVIGILHNRFKFFWDAAVDCLGGLLEVQKRTIWETFMHYLQSCQTLFLSGKDSPQSQKSIDGENLDLESRLEQSQHDTEDSTDAGTLVTLLLKAVQKVPKIAETRSRQLIPLFLAFVGCADPAAEGLMEAKVLSGGKDWKVVLKEWLNLLSLMKNARSFFRGPAVKDMLNNR